MNRYSCFKLLLIIGISFFLNPHTCRGDREILSNIQTIYDPDLQFNRVPNFKFGSIPYFSNFQNIAAPSFPGSNPLVIPNFNVPAYSPVPTVNTLPLPNAPLLSIGNLPEQWTPIDMLQPRLYHHESVTYPENRPVAEGEFCGKFEALDNKSKFPPAITLFKRHVALQVQNSPVLSKLFNIEQEISPNDFAWGRFYLVMLLAVEVSYNNPSYIAHLSNRYIAVNRNRITSQDIITTYSSALALLMYHRRLLRCENATNLAESYANLMEDTANRLTIDKCPISKVAAFVLGYVNFLKSLNLFNAQDLPETARICGDQWKFLEANGPRKVVPAIEVPPLRCSNCHPNLKPDDNLCAFSSKPIEIFLSTFMRLVQSSPIFKELLNLNEIPPEDFYKAAFYASQYILQYSGCLQSAFYAEFASRALKDCKALSPEVFLRVRGVFMAKFLWFKHALNEGNAQSLAEKYVRNIEENAKKIVNLQFPISKFVVLTVTSISFPSQLGILPNRNASHTLAYMFGNEMRCHCLN